MDTELEQKVIISSRKRRITAFLIDHFVLTFLMVSILFIILGSDFIDDDNIEKLSNTILVVMIPGFIIYISKDSINGNSIGKWIMGIAIRDQNNHNIAPTFGRLIIRNIFIIIWPIEFIVLASNEEKKRLGDKVSKTIVIKNPNSPKKPPRILALIGIGAAFILFTTVFIGSTMKNSEAYSIAVYEIAHDEEILTETSGIEGFGIVPKGNISVTNGKGQAQLQIKVKGKEMDLTINAYLVKESNSDWQLIKLNKQY